MCSSTVHYCPDHRVWDMITIMSAVIAPFLSPLLQGERNLTDGAFLFHRGDRVTSLFQILDGTVELVRHQEDGTPVVLQRGRPGDILAEASVFNERYHCDAIATGTARLAVLPMADLRRMLTQAPGFAEAWARHLTAEVRRARLRSEILSLRTVAERLDAWLSAEDRVLPAKGSWKSLAKEIGVSPEALYRELAQRPISLGKLKRSVDLSKQTELKRL